MFWFIVLILYFFLSGIISLSVIMSLLTTFLYLSHNHTTKSIFCFCLTLSQSSPIAMFHFFMFYFSFIQGTFVRGNVMCLSLCVSLVLFTYITHAPFGAFLTYSSSPLSRYNIFCLGSPSLFGTLLVTTTFLRLSNSSITSVFFQLWFIIHFFFISSFH